MYHLGYIVCIYCVYYTLHTLTTTTTTAPLETVKTINHTHTQTLCSHLSPGLGPAGLEYN